jgi:hypothetical protein
MSTEQNNQEVMYIQEAADGGAVVDLPPSIPSPEAQQNESVDPVETDDDDAAAEAAEIQANGFVDPEAQAIREAKRAKRRSRKDYHRSVQAEKDAKLAMLEQQNRQLLERVQVVERKALGQDLARLDKRISDEQNSIIYAKQKIKEAADTGNGDLMVSAQELLLEASRNYESLVNQKRRFTTPPPQKEEAPDPMVTRHSQRWISKNTWYNPRGQDRDSKIALAEDQQLVSEGYDPSSQDYWFELDKRLQKVLPHRYTDDMDENPVRTQRPRNFQTGSGREHASSSDGRNTITLSPEKVKAMKDAGMWDDPVKRAKMIKRYALEAKNLNT